MSQELGFERERHAFEKDRLSFEKIRLTLIEKTLDLERERHTFQLQTQRQQHDFEMQKTVIDRHLLTIDKFVSSLYIGVFCVKIVMELGVGWVDDGHILRNMIVCPQLARTCSCVGVSSCFQWDNTCFRCDPTHTINR